MTAWYEVEELAGRWWHGWAAGAASYPRHDDAAVAFDSLRDVLGIYFRALGGGAGIELTTARSADQDHRLSWRQRLGLAREPMELARFDGEHLVLPGAQALFPDRADNRRLYFWQTAFLARSRHVAETRDPLQRDLLYLAGALATTATLLEELPGWRAPYTRLSDELLALRPARRLPEHERAVEQLVRHLLGETNSLGALAARMHGAVVTDPASIASFSAPPGYRPPLPVPLWPRLERARPATAADEEKQDDEDEPGGDGKELGEKKFRARRRQLDQSERDDPLMLNPFEKLISWAEMVNVNRAVDDDDEEDARKAAHELDELAISKHRRKAATRLKMQLEIAPEAVAEGHLLAERTVPEWHYRRRCLMPDYCAVQVITPKTKDRDWHPDADTRARIRRVRRQFEALRPRREMLRGQLDGDEFDTDALVRRQTEIAAGHSGSDRIYTAWRDLSRDLAVNILIDISLSTDAWIDDRRVLDIEKEALLVLAHGIEACGDALAIHAFSSHRRKRVEITPLKDFSEPMGATIERRIAALEPGRYTRMGAAVRHLTEELAERPDSHRLLLVLTDGKPNDTDHYEGRWAIEDTRMAVRAARRRGLVVFGVTIDTRARQYFPLIFGRAGYAIVPRAAALSRALPAIYRQLVGH